MCARFLCPLDMVVAWCGKDINYLVSRNRKKSSARKFHFVHLNIRDGRPESAAPVDQTITSVNCSVLVHPDEGLGDGLAALGVHGERASVPVDRAAQLPQLIIDGIACQEQPVN